MKHDPFVIERTFAAPRALLWAAFSKAEHLGQWLSPAGMKPGRNLMEFREGGIYHYEIVPPEGPSHWGRWIFRQIIDQELMVTHASFSDEGCGISQHPMAPTWPLEMLSKTYFNDAREGSQLRMEISALGSDPAQLETFAAGRPSMTAGWGGTFEHLDAFLANAHREH